MKFTAACVQLNTQNNLKNNITKASELITQASNNGADFIITPENTSFISTDKKELSENTWLMEEHPAIQAFQNLSAKLGKWVLIGSTAIKLRDSTKLANRSILIDNNGEIRSFYDKIHLFDVSIKGGESHRESERFAAGKIATLTPIPWCTLGMTICYDLRFPNLYNKLANAGASIITVPSAFTEYTGKAHWHILLQARAIETGCFIIAPAQTGSHPYNRKTFGHSIIVNPWGRILADAEIEPGIITAEIDSSMSDEIRQQLPNLKHAREFNIT